MFTKLGRDEVLMAPQMHYGVSARSTQGRIQGRAKIGQGGPLLQETSSLARKAPATNRMYNNDLEACVAIFVPFRSQMFYAFIILR